MKETSCVPDFIQVKVDTLTSSSWFIGSVKKAVRLRLFCFPPAGRGASIYAGWQRSFPPDINVCPVQLPGRENRLNEAPYRTVADLINALMPLMDQFLDVPYVFFGHSMGALISFELAGALLRRGHPSPMHVFISARRAPHLADPHPPIAHLSDDLFLEAVQRRYQGIPSSFLGDAETREIILRSLRPDFLMLENYEFRNRIQLQCPVSVFGGSQDQDIGKADLEPWREHCVSKFGLKIFPGDHFFILHSGDLVIEEIKQILGRGNTGGR